jgi:hypothetical protein
VIQSRIRPLVLFLIIAASVLMMVALTLIFMFQSGASSTTQQADAQTCRSSAQAQCSNFGSASIVAPTSCYTQEAGEYQPISGISWTVYETDGLSTDIGTAGSPSPPFHLDCSDVL